MRAESSPLSLPPKHAARVLLAGLLLLVPGMAMAAGETTGEIRGYVYDPTGQPMAMVPLTIRGAALPAPSEATSGDDGVFEFASLPPGDDYELEVKVEGFQAIKQPGIHVRVGQATPVDVHLTVITEAEPAAEYRIVEKINPVMNPDSAQAVSTIDAEKAAETPVFHQVEAMAQQAAGVSLSNRPSTRGGLARWGKFYVDGMDTTDITDGSITAPMNFDSVQSFEIITGGFDAQYNSLGMVENAVTKSGTNRLTYDLSLTLAPAFATAKNLTASNQPEYTGTLVNSPAAGPSTTFYSPIVNIGGPIVQDRLWFYASGQANFSHRESPLFTPDAGQENRPTDTNTRLARLKLTWAPTSADRVDVAFHYDHNSIDNAIGSPSVARAAEENIDRGGYFLILNADHKFSESLLLQVRSGLTYKKVDLAPATDGISHRDGTGFTRFALGSLSFDQVGNFLHETKYRYQFDPTLVFRRDEHQFKAGVQLSYQQDTQRTGVTDGVRYLDRGNGVCNPDDPSTFAYCGQRVSFYNPNGGNGDLVTHANVVIVGAFVQDRITLNRYLTVVPGFRVDWSQISGESAANGGPGTAAHLLGWGPRVSGVYDLFGDRRSLVVAGYGRSNDVGNIFVAQHANPTLLQVASRFDAGTQQFAACDPAAGSSASCQVSGGLAGRSFAGGQKPPFVDEVTAGFHQELTEQTAAGIDLTYRHYGRMWADEEVSRIWDQSGTQIVGYVDPAHPSSRLLTQARSDAYRNYWGADLWLQGTPGRWDILASYTLSFTRGTQGLDYFADGYLTNPRFTRFYDGWVPDDRRHMLKASVAYQTTFGLDLGMRVRYVTGNPIWQSFINPGDPTQRVYRSPRGTGFATGPTGAPDFNDPSTWIELRNPSQFIVDLQARYNLGALLDWSQRLEVVALVVNALNSSDPVDLRDVYTAGAGNTFGLVNSRQPPLQAELMLRLRN